jgi:hypothetical protein
MPSCWNVPVEARCSAHLRASAERRSSQTRSGRLTPGAAWRAGKLLERGCGISTEGNGGCTFVVGFESFIDFFLGGSHGDELINFEMLKFY